MPRRILAIALAVVAYNFFFLSNSPSHTTIGFVWLVADITLWLPEIGRLLARP